TSQLRTLDEGHREEVNAVDLVDVVDGTEVRMVNGGGQAGLALEALQDWCPRASRKVRHLEGHLAAQPRILGQVDGAHAASAEFLEDAIAAELLRQVLVWGHGDSIWLETCRAILSTFLSIYNRKG